MVSDAHVVVYQKNGVAFGLPVDLISANGTDGMIGCIMRARTITKYDLGYLFYANLQVNLSG